MATEGDNRTAIPTKVGRWWSVAVPGSEVGTMLRIEWDELAALDAAEGARVEIVGMGAVRFRAPFTKREIRRWLACVVDWPGVEVV